MTLRQGDGTTTNRITAVQVSGLSGVVVIDAGHSHNIVFKSDGTTTNRTTPVQVSSLSGVTAIATGNGCSFAITSDGTGWAWGRNDYGQLGDGTTTHRSAPVVLTGADRRALQIVVVCKVEMKRTQPVGELALYAN